MAMEEGRSGASWTVGIFSVFFSFIRKFDGQSTFAGISPGF